MLESIEDSNIVSWNIEKITQGNHYVSISGWAFIENEPPKIFNCSILLKSTITNECIEIPTTLVKRSDLNDLFTDGTDYTHSGFFTKVNVNKINLANNDYEILIKYFNNGHQIIIDTKQPLFNNQGE